MEEAPTLPPHTNETNKLDYYKPYFPTDEESKKNFSDWINYPGLLRFTRISRQLHK